MPSNLSFRGRYNYETLQWTIKDKDLLLYLNQNENEIAFLMLDTCEEAQNRQNLLDVNHISNRQKLNHRQDGVEKEEAWRISRIFR